MLDQREVVRDEQVRKPQVALQIFEQVDHLGLHGHVERADRLVEHQEFGLYRKRPRDTESLSLAAAELMRIPIDVFRAQADFLQLSESESIIASQNDGIE